MFPGRLRGEGLEVAPGEGGLARPGLARPGLALARPSLALLVAATATINMPAICLQ